MAAFGDHACLHAGAAQHAGTCSILKGFEGGKGRSATLIMKFVDFWQVLPAAIKLPVTAKTLGATRIASLHSQSGCMSALIDQYRQHGGRDSRCPCAAMVT